MREVKYSHKVIALFLAINIFQGVLPYNLLYASNNGPNAPEASGFEPVAATDMVNLASGDMSYVLPIMDVSGMPVSLSYHGGVPLDLESTWTGLGWNLNTGAINRGLNATPDDWNGGQSVDFIRYSDSEDTYTVNVGVGIGKAAEVGVGASWGSNKSLSGSVFASIGLSDHFGASASIDTNGNYSLGVSAGTGINGEAGGSFGGGLSISGNVNGGKIGVGVGAGIRTSNGMTMGIGTSLDGGMSISMGYSASSGNGINKTGAGGGASLSTSSFSAGEWEISSKGWYIPIQIYFISFGFGKQKVTHKLKKGYKKQGYGILYNNNLNLASDAIENDPNADNAYNDYQNRYRYADAYDQSLPVPEEEFVSDYDSEREKLNFTYSAYDNYDVNATGISGVMQPRVLQNSTVFGLGYSGSDPYNTQGSPEEPGKMRVYWHNTNVTEKSLASSLSSNRINFYFNGQFTQNVNANGYLTATTLSNPLIPQNVNSLTLQGSLSSRGSVSNPRLKQGNFVEVFTNEEIKNGQAIGLLSPLNPIGNGLDLQALDRNNVSEYKNAGIGAYKITAPDGKVYHFSQPVYHFEMVERNVLKDTSELHVSEKRQYTPYATHWLLTAITGPDFIDTNNNNVADDADLGYWVRMDYGKWSDGYVWRNPTDKNLKDYTTNIQGNIGTKDFGTYQFGRKQLYYLDRIVSATQTAYFVKNLRYDSVGSDLTYRFETNPDFGINQQITNNGTNVVSASTNPAINPFENFTYKKQMQLMLQKIVLVKNSIATISKGNSSNPLLLNSNSIVDYVKNYPLGFNSSGGFFEEYNVNGQVTSVLMNNESGVYDVKDFENFNYDDAIKIIDFEYNYNLAVRDHTNTNNDPNKSNGSPGTIQCATNPNAGKLCLKRVKFLGRNNFDYMPPYEFEYKGEYKGLSTSYIKYPANAIVKKQTFNNQFIFGNNWRGLIPSNVSNLQNGITVMETPIIDARAKDEWGFLKDIPGQESEVAAAAWTLTQIKTPTGASIDFEHEEDDFYIEAFSRRYWMEGLRFVFSNVNNKLRIVVDKEPDNLAIANLDFSKYFKADRDCWVDIWACARHDYNDWGCKTRKATVNIEGDEIDIIQVNSNSMILECSLNYLVTDNGNPLFNRAVTTNGGPGFILGGNVRGTCGNPPGCINVTDRLVFNYKLIANNVPEDENGGGLRVKSIILKDEVGNRYKTAYYYNKPGTNKNKNVGNYKSSGITSYSPVRGQKFVPYQSELPSPGVMYEYVTMVAEDINGNNLGETLYQFFTLQPVLDIFNEQIEMKDIDNTTIFKANVVDYNTNPLQILDYYMTVFGEQIPVYRTENYLNPTKKIKSKSIKLDINTSLIGQLKSIKTFNKFGQLMSDTQKKYLSGYALKSANINRGSITESFQSMKSVFTANSDDGNLTLKNRFLSVSTKEDFNSVLQSITTTGVHGKTIETYSKTDPETGAFLVVETKKADGTLKRVERMPAYKKYPQLGSKSTNPNNKNMLTQEAMSVTAVLKNGFWNATNANITTWNNNWTYRDNIGSEFTPSLNREKIWRKSKSFVLKTQFSIGALQNYGDLSNSNIGFDWDTGFSISDRWKKVSEITRYNHFSSPLEAKDFNNNFASSKMADNDTKVIVSGNTRYTEMYYSGAEYLASGNYFEGEVQGANYVSDDVAHTGDFSVKVQSPQEKAFEVNGTSGSVNYYQNPDNYVSTFRPGKYKVSVWVLENNIPSSILKANLDNGTDLILNNQVIPVSEVIMAGCWKQFNYYIDIPANFNNSIYIKNNNASSSSAVYYDDFRLHPISSSVNSFVYDHNTDQLSYTLDSNNMASAYLYDDAGRLKATYVETENHPDLYGGLKITSQVKQKYKSSNDVSSNSPSTINNCLSISYDKMNVDIKNECIATFENRFRTFVTGGSGNFSYQYKWLLNNSTGQFSDWIDGSESQLIQYSPQMCENLSYNKKWDFVVKVTDNITGETLERDYNYSTEGCQFSIKNWADLQITNCNTYCGDKKFSFKIHLKDISMEGDFIYEYAYYNPELPFKRQDFINVTDTKGNFCPNWNMIEDKNCPSGYRDYVHLAFKVTNQTTGAVSNGIVMFIGDCTGAGIANPLITLSDLGRKYLEGGTIILQNVNGDVEQISNVKNVVK